MPMKKQIIFPLLFMVFALILALVIIVLAN